MAVQTLVTRNIYLFFFHFNGIGRMGIDRRHGRRGEKTKRRVPQKCDTFNTSQNDSSCPIISGL